MRWGSLLTYSEASYMIFIEPILSRIAKFTVSLYSIAVTKNESINENKFVALVVIFWVVGFFLNLS